MATKKKVYPNKVKAQFKKVTRTGKTVPDYEAEFWHYLIKYHGIAEYMLTQQHIPKGQFRPFADSKHTCDFAWPDHKLIVEIDGGQWVANGGRHNRDSDREKLNKLAVDGWRVMRFSGQMLLNDPEKCVKQVYAALEYPISKLGVDKG